MKNIAITIFVLLLISVIALFFISFQVRQTESALVMTFGKPSRQITEPGWYFKWPPPIEWVYTFDSRMRVFEAQIGETTTKGAVPIIVNTYVVWKIADPLNFYNSVKTIEEAETKLRSRISDTQNKVIGQHTFSEFVNSDRSKIKFHTIENEMFANLSDSVRKDFGIEIKTLGIKQLKVNKDVTKDVFGRMRAERNRKTEATMSEGEAQARKIRTEADAMKTELLAAAEGRAKAIRGEGDAEAAKYYKMLDEEPLLAIFLRNIEAVKKILSERSTIILSTDTEPFKLLRQIPKLSEEK
jgi:membrane protease subunit HflC